MARTSLDNLDYLAARLHARRSRMAENDRLKALCAARTIPELCRGIGLEREYQSPADFQRRLAANLANELAGFTRHIGDAGAGAFSCLLTRFEIENVKVLVRGILNKIPADEIRPHLVPVPERPAMEMQRLVSADSLESLAALLPNGKPYQRLRDAIIIQPNPASSFFLETALDGGYFQELARQIRELSGEDLAAIQPLVQQEANFFRFMLVMRGKFVYGLSSESLLASDPGGGSQHWLGVLLAMPDILAAAKAGLGIVLDELPAGQAFNEKADYLALLEALSWQRYQRLANSAFRRGHMGLGAVFGYAGLRRMEVANLTTLSEAMGRGMAGEEIYARWFARRKVETGHV